MVAYLNTETLEVYKSRPEKDIESYSTLDIIEVEYPFLHIAKKLLSLGYPYKKEKIDKVYIHDKYYIRISIYLTACFMPLSDEEIVADIIEQGMITLSKTFELGKTDSETFHNFVNAIDYLEKYFDRYGKINRMEYIANSTLVNGIPLGNDLYTLNGFAVNSDSFINEFSNVLYNCIYQSIPKPIICKTESITIDDSSFRSKLYQEIYEDFLSIIYSNNDDKIDINKFAKTMNNSRIIVEEFASLCDSLVLCDPKKIFNEYTNIAIMIWVHITLYNIRYSNFISAKPRLYIYDSIVKIQNILKICFCGRKNNES